VPDGPAAEPDAPAAEPPLARLFAIAYRLLIDGLHERLQALGWTDVRPAFGFALLAARDRPTSGTELAELMGTTKQAASKLADTMVAAGYLERGVSTEDARQRPLHLTARGRKLLSSVEQIYADLEGDWARVIGPAQVQRMRTDLVRVVSTGPEGGLPPVRPTW
jgi:DNA-binding MarR family transcriptional regulator